MKCPICQSETKVTNSRTTTKGTRRRRECIECLTRFSTHETLLVQSMDKHLVDKYIAKIGG
jgi:transcriptional regulator NrdR family protein